MRKRIFALKYPFNIILMKWNDNEKAIKSTLVLSNEVVRFNQDQNVYQRFNSLFYFHKSKKS